MKWLFVLLFTIIFVGSTFYGTLALLDPEGRGSTFASLLFIVAVISLLIAFSLGVFV